VADFPERSKGISIKVLETKNSRSSKRFKISFAVPGLVRGTTGGDGQNFIIGKTGNGTNQSGGPGAATPRKRIELDKAIFRNFYRY